MSHEIVQQIPKKDALRRGLVYIRFNHEGRAYVGETSMGINRIERRSLNSYPLFFIRHDSLDCEDLRCSAEAIIILLLDVLKREPDNKSMARISLTPLHIELYEGLLAALNNFSLPVWKFLEISPLELDSGVNKILNLFEGNKARHL